MVGVKFAGLPMDCDKREGDLEGRGFMIWSAILVLSTISLFVFL